MKGFLFDENLPARVRFQPGSPIIPAKSLGDRPKDSAIWEHARREELVIVTKDSDFSSRMILHTPPPWVVHLKFGNLGRRDYHALLARLWPKVEALLPHHKLVNVFHDRVEAVR